MVASKTIFWNCLKSSWWWTNPECFSRYPTLRDVVGQHGLFTFTWCIEDVNLTVAHQWGLGNEVLPRVTAKNQARAGADCSAAAVRNRVRSQGHQDVGWTRRGKDFGVLQFDGWPKSIRAAIDQGRMVIHVDTFCWYILYRPFFYSGSVELYLLHTSSVWPKKLQTSSEWPSRSCWKCLSWPKTNPCKFRHPKKKNRWFDPDVQDLSENYTLWFTIC